MSALFMRFPARADNSAVFFTYYVVNRAFGTIQHSTSVKFLSSLGLVGQNVESLYECWLNLLVGEIDLEALKFIESLK